MYVRTHSRTRVHVYVCNLLGVRGARGEGAYRVYANKMHDLISARKFAF